jgi:hypothetical protein
MHFRDKAKTGLSSGWAMGTKIEWFVYNTGPSTMEAIFAKSIDLTYVGPGPALNAYTKSNGEETRLIAGAANGGAGLVVQADQNLKAPADFRGKKIATPQLGNTQNWAFAWRSLMAAEIYVTILTGFGLGHLLHYGRELKRDGPGDWYHAGHRRDRFVGGQNLVLALGTFSPPPLGNGPSVGCRCWSAFAEFMTQQAK